MRVRNGAEVRYTTTCIYIYISNTLYSFNLANNSLAKSVLAIFIAMTKVNHSDNEEIRQTTKKR